jgi:rRNA maturation protein Rpf1
MDIGLRNAHERVVLVETREGNPFRLDSMDPSKGMEWSKHIYIGIKTRKDLGIAVTVPPLNEDVPIGVIGECDPVLKEIIMRIFNARDGIDSDVLIKLGKKDSVTLIDFIRKDVSSSPVGPQIRVKEYADDDPSQ